MRHPVNVAHHEHASFGQRLADRMSAAIGSWPFLIIQSALLVAWMLYNGCLAWAWLHWRVFDPFPWLLLNICLSFQAAYTGPVLLIAANRQTQKDRMTLEHASAEADSNDQRMYLVLLAITVLLREARADTTQLEDAIAGLCAASESSTDSHRNHPTAGQDRGQP